MKEKDRVIDIILNKEIRVGSVIFKVVDILFILALWVIALMARIKLFPIVSADYYGFLEKWMNQIKELGGFASLGTQISNYTSPYMYLMCMVSGFDNSLYALKVISVIFDYSASVAVFAIVHRITGSTNKSILGMAFLLLCPATIIDSAYWCQCDVIYTSFILWALYLFFKDKSVGCFVLLGIAFSFKLQTLFIMPFIIIMWLKKRTVRIRDIFIIPVIYIVAQLPAWMFGRSFKELMLIYFDQSSYYPWGTLEYPNIYALLDETIDTSHHMTEVSSAGTWMTLIVLGFVAYYIYSKRVKITNELAITIALFTVAIVPYSLPHMHDRYGFLIDLIAIVYVMLRPKKLPVFVGFSLVSLVTFMPYLTATHIFSIRTVAVFMLGLITFVGYDLYRQMQENALPDEVIEEEISIAPDEIVSLDFDELLDVDIDEDEEDAEGEIDIEVYEVEVKAQRDAYIDA